MAFTWDVAPDKAFPELFDAYARTIFQAGNQAAHQRAQEMEAWAKDNAPWQDRTGAARAGLHAEVQETGGIGAITLAHGVDYGLWLEIAHAGRYAIIAKAIDHFAPLLMADLQRIVSGGALAGFTFSGSAARFRELSTGRFVSRRSIVERLAGS